MKQFTMWTCALALGGCATTDLDNQPGTAEAAQDILGSPEGGDLMGAAFAVGDFDGDTFTDLAVSAPGEKPGSGARTGAVFIYRGSEAGLIPWSTISEAEINPSFATDDDEFGASLAAADFDGDGKVDLAIGAPRARAQTSNGAHGGVVYVVWGRAGGPTQQGALTLDQNSATGSTSEKDDLFGETLATGDLDGDGHPDLAIGVPGENVTENGITLRRGWVNTLTSHGRGFDNRAGVTSVDHVENAGFATSLAIADVDNNGLADLIVGAPFQPDPGAVFIYRSTATGYMPGMIIRSSQPGDEFGAQIVVGHFDDDRYPNGSRESQLMISAPQRNSGAGRLFQYNPDKTNGFAMRLKRSVGLDTFGTGATAGDRFGAALAANDIDDDQFTDLVVGIPGKDLLSFGMGAVIMSDINGPHALSLLTWGFAQNGSHTELPDPDDFLGTTVAVGRFDHVNGADVVLGMPGRKVHGTGTFDAGAFLEYDRTNTGDHHQELRRYWDQGAL